MVNKKNTHKEITHASLLTDCRSELHQKTRRTVLIHLFPASCAQLREYSGDTPADGTALLVAADGPRGYS